MRRVRVRPHDGGWRIPEKIPICEVYLQCEQERPFTFTRRKTMERLSRHPDAYLLEGFQSAGVTCEPKRRVIYRLSSVVRHLCKHGLGSVAYDYTHAICTVRDVWIPELALVPADLRPVIVNDIPKGTIGGVNPRCMRWRDSDDLLEKRDYLNSRNTSRCKFLNKRGEYEPEAQG
jgi:hypothetical protein